MNLSWILLFPFISLQALGNFEAKKLIYILPASVRAACSTPALSPVTRLSWLITTPLNLRSTSRENKSGPLTTAKWTCTSPKKKVPSSPDLTEILEILGIFLEDWSRLYKNFLYPLSPSKNHLLLSVLIKPFLLLVFVKFLLLEVKGANSDFF